MTQHCPICNSEVEPSERYPDYICSKCVEHAKTEDGQLLLFYNQDLSGGFIAVIKSTNRKYNSHICFIDKQKCYADEARFGGIVVRPYKNPSLFKKITDHLLT